MPDDTRWTVKVSKETDIAVRSYLAEHGGKKGDLSKFIERAVQKEVFRATLRDVRERNADLSEDEIQALVDEEVATVRKEFWRDRRLQQVARSDDPADDFLLAICTASDADYLVTGDKAGLLALKSHGRTAIVTARGFLDRLSGA